MPEDTGNHLQLEHPAPGATLAPGRHCLRGWAWPESSRHIVDVRARAGGRIFPGVHGLPRSDIAAHFKTGRPWALAGFEIVVELAGDQIDIVIEVLEIDGRWTPQFRTRFHIDSSMPRTDFPVPVSPLRWHDFCRGLDFLLHARRNRPEAGWTELTKDLAAEIPRPASLRSPSAPLIGYLDEPAAVGGSRFGRIAVLGHVFHATQPIRRIWATTDLQALQPVDCGRKLADVAAHYPQYPNAQACGFFGLVDVPSQLPNPITVRIYVETVDGTLHLAHAAQTRRHDADLDKRAYAAGTAAGFDEALSAWEQALHAAGIPVSTGAELDAGLARLREECQHRQAAAGLGHRLHPIRAVTQTTTQHPRHAILATHSLDLEGAPLFLLDLARHLAEAGTRITISSPSDGPLRARFEAGGARVGLIDTRPLFAAQSEEEARAALAGLAGGLDFGDCDLVVTNTFTAFWAVHIAKAAGRRVLSYVHESTTPADFYRGRMSRAIVAFAERAFCLADAVSFTTESTRGYHLDYGRTDNHYLVPGWIDVERIDSWRAAHPREELRARFGLQPDGLLVTNIGTVSDRKGQHTFARAVDLLWRRYPALAARTSFVMLGGRQTLFDTRLRDLLGDLNRPNLIVHPETSGHLPYYAAADLTVCTSYEESSPRVVLEAMACGTPLLATHVHGIPEFVRPGLEAVLMPAGDTEALCEALARLLLSPGIGRDLAARARARVVQHFEAANVLPRHLALAAAVASGAARQPVT